MGYHYKGKIKRDSDWFDRQYQLKKDLLRYWLSDGFKAKCVRSMK